MRAAIRYPRPPELKQLGTRHAVVEASAGTGKTYLLEHLVVELLLNHGARMEEILVVTFTERATAELCLRLRNKLSELCHLSADHPAAAEPPDERCWLIDDTARGRLCDALLAFDRATISTIHGFCRGILGDHAFLHQRMFDEQAVDESDAFHTAFVQSLRNDFAVHSELLPYLRAWLAAGHSAADLERGLGMCTKELARIFPSRPEALQPQFDEAALAVAIAAWPAQAACDPTLTQRLKQAKVHARTAAAVCPRLLALTEIVLNARGADRAAAFLGAVERFVADDSQKDVWAYLLGALAKGAADPRVREVREALANLVAVTPPLLAAVARKFLPLVRTHLQERKRAAGLYDFQDMLTL